MLAVRPHELVVVAAPGLAAAADPRRPGPAALAGRQAWLLREPGSGTRAATDALLTELDIAPLTLMVGSNGAIRESASVGLGVTLISRDAVAAELAARRLAALPSGHPAAPGLVPGGPPGRPAAGRLPPVSWPAGPSTPLPL